MNLKQRFLDIKAHKTIQQLIKYLITGFTAFGIEYGLYVLLLKVWAVNYIVASALVYTLMFWFVFLVNRFWSFKSTGDMKKQIVQYGLLFVFNLIVGNVLLMTLLTDVLGMSAYLSPFFKTACVVSWNFLIYKYLIYK